MNEPNPEEILERPADPPDATLTLGPLPENLADVYLPRPGRRRTDRPATVVVIHGGYWRAAYDRIHTRPMSQALAERGHTVAAIEFRRTGMPGGGWPGTFDDVRLALTALTPALDDVAPDRSRRLLLIGHSAGGHLALWAGAQLGPDAIPGLSGIVALAGVCDLRLAFARGLGHHAVDALLGGGPEAFPERYAAADPMLLPVPAVPVVLVHGREDTVVPIELSERYAGRAAGQEPGVQLVALDGVEHFGVIDPRSSAWEAVTAALEGSGRR